MKIRITVPVNKSDKWKMSWPGYGKHFLRADTLLNGMERRFLGSAKWEKLALTVKYTDGTFNETLGSTDAGYLLYTLSCFLEDYLSDETLKRIERKYAN